MMFKKLIIIVTVLLFLICSLLTISPKDTNAQPLIKTLLAELDSNDQTVRESAARKLGQSKSIMGPHSRVLICEKLAAKLSDQSPEVRTAVAISLSRMGADAVPFVKEGLNSETQRTRQAASLAAENLGKTALPLKPLVIKKLKTGTDPITTQHLLSLLGKFGYNSNTNLQLFEHYLQSDDETISLIAANALIQVGTQKSTDQALNFLTSKLADDSFDNKEGALETLAKIDREAARTAIREFHTTTINTEDRINNDILLALDETKGVSSRIKAMQALAENGKNDQRSAVALLELFLHSPNNDIASVAGNLLSNMNENAVTALDNALLTSSDDKKLKVMELLSTMESPEAKRIVEEQETME